MKKLLIPALLALVLLAGCAEHVEPVPPPVEPAPAPVQPVPRVEIPEPEPPVLLLTAPESAAASADEPTVTLTCHLEQSGDTPAQGRLQVLQNNLPVMEKTIPLETCDIPVTLSYEFTRYMEKTGDTVEFRLTAGGEVITARTRIALENWPDEVYAKESGDPRPYAIEVVKNHDVVLVYGLDEDHQYTRLVKTFLCSTGAWTPLGHYTAYERYPGWRSLYANPGKSAYCYGQYSIAFSGDYLFHSVPYFTPDKGNLEYEEFNKLGSPASLGCVRLAVGDVKWLFENCPNGTPVSIVTRDELGVEKPTPVYIDPNSPNRGWDPTDPDPENPWHIEG